MREQIGMTDNTLVRAGYFYFSPITTRWHDNDLYGHVNNVTYYSYFDTAANKYLIEEGGLDIQTAAVVGFVVSSKCQYLAPITYPDNIDIGFRVNRLGNSSVEYGLAVFKQGENFAVAHGSFTHVFVNRASNKSVPIPASIKSALERALVVL